MRKLYRLVILVICIISLSACTIRFGSINNGDTDKIFEGHVLAKANGKVDINELELNVDESYQEFVRKLQVFSAKLTVAAYNDSDKNENLCISPVSVYMALAMTITNANGEAKEELLNAVGVTIDEVNNFTKYLYSYLKKEKYKYDDSLKMEKLASILDMNNSIWIDDAISLKQEGLANLANNFMADSYKVSFKNDNEKANELLSKYVDIKTRGLIKPKLQLTKDTLFALVNTLYMKDFWAGCDDKLNFTKNELDFKTASGEVIKKQFLESPYNYGRVIEAETYKHFYVKTDSGYNLKMFIPKDGYTLSDIFTVNNLVDVTRTNNYYGIEEEITPDGYVTSIEHHTRTIFPSFEASYDNNLVDIFKKDFNVSNIFNPGQHMTGLTDIDNLFISQIIHQTKLKVDETGVEGAAVTIVAFEVESCGPIMKKYDFVIDRAFAYVLTDNGGNILFSGVVNNI